MTDGDLTHDAYRVILRAAHSVRFMARSVDVEQLDAAIAAVDRAAAAGPVLDPTLFIRSAGFMEQDREVLVAVRALAALGQPAPAEAST